MEYGFDFDVSEPEMDSKPSTKVVRTKTRERYLMKSAAVREMLKWKYNYFEVNPREHRLYRSFMQKHHVHRQSFKFKQLWRLAMDELFRQEAVVAIKKILNMDLKKRLGVREPKPSIPDPSRMLVNYDREILNSMRKIREEFRFYVQYPKCYPNFDEEKHRFLSQNLGQNIESDIDKRFQFYWESRVSTLCDMKIASEKQNIRKHWKKLLPVYYDTGDFSYPEEVQALLLPDDEDNDDNNDELGDSGVLSRAQDDDFEMTSDEEK